MIGSLVMAALTVNAQPRYNLEKMNREVLDRGVVAVKNGQQVAVSWRTLTSDAPHQPYDIYRNGEKLNPQPLTSGGTFFIDEQPLAGDVIYEIKGDRKSVV